MPFVEYVRQKFELAQVRTTNEYALKSFFSYMRGRTSGELTPEILTGWIASLFLNGKKAVTVKRYLCRLNVIHQEWQSTALPQHHNPASPQPFAGLLDLADPAYQVDDKRISSNLTVVRKLITPDLYAGPEGKWKAIFFWLLYNPGSTAEDAVNLTFDSASKYCPQTVEIIESMDSSHGRRYVFDLRQPDRRVPGMARELTDRVSGLLDKAGMRFSHKFSLHDISAMWIAAALRTGLKPEEIRAFVSDVPDEYAILSKIAPASLSGKERQSLICRVADAVNDITTRWYVFSMRDRNTPEDVKECIREAYPALFGKIQFYYPTRYAYRQSRRKKLVRHEVPFLPGLLFMKVRSDMVGRLMGKITRVGWGYRYSSLPESPYSVITQKAMTEFQRHIGVFTDDIKVELVKTAKTFEEGQEVMILRSDLLGKIGRIESVKTTDGKVYYTIQLTEDTAFRITVNDLEGLYLDPLD